MSDWPSFWKCPDCKGTGQYFYPKYQCQRCDGTGNAFVDGVARRRARAIAADHAEPMTALQRILRP